VAVQEVRCDAGSSQPADNYTFFYGNGNVKHHLGKDFFIHQGLRSAVKRAESFSDRMSDIILRHWCDITGLKLPTN
jgi:hypothetical protein